MARDLMRLFMIKGVEFLSFIHDEPPSWREKVTQNLNFFLFLTRQRSMGKKNHRAHRFSSHSGCNHANIRQLMALLSTYIHHLDPVIFEIPDTPLALRWYGLAYVAGFFLGFLVLRMLSKRKLYCMPEEKLGDFITGIAVFGVLLGGRLGEFFFYWLPRVGFSGLADDPFWVLRVWEGGMASHGGIIGVFLVCWYYARRFKLPLVPLADGLAIVAPIGICFGRLANFINGELYGRVASAGNALAMKFPLEIRELVTSSPAQWMQMQLAAIQASPTPPSGQLRSYASFNEWIIEMSRQHEPVRLAIGEYLTPRYPSQLFEAFFEGFLIFITLIALRFFWKKAPAGIFCAIFCFMYAAGRIFCEYYREPEDALWMNFTRGQYLSFGVILVGIIFLAIALRSRKNTASV